MRRLLERRRRDVACKRRRRRIHDGNEIDAPPSIVIRSLEPTVLAVDAGPADGWTADQYELRISGGAPLALADLRRAADRRRRRWRARRRFRRCAFELEDVR